MSKYKGKKALVVGFGGSGVAAARYLVKQGAKVTVTDQRDKSHFKEALSDTSDLKIDFEFGKHNEVTFMSAELIVVSPGVPLTIKPLQEAVSKSIPLTNEIEMAVAALKEPLVCVTGTNGKTTTVTLIGEMFRRDNRAPFVGGNIGRPLIEYVQDKEKSDVVVAELSSFQLELTEKLVPAVAVVTNIDQDHLDRYPNMDAYIAAKRKLIKACDRNSFVVLNYDDPIVREFARDCAGKVVWFTLKDPMSIGGEFAENFQGAFVSADKKQIRAKISGREEVYDLSKLKIFGDHNRENLMAAICSVRMLGVSPKAIQEVIDTFPGVPHRLEYVMKKGGVFFFNDSKSTNPNSLKRSIQAFNNRPIVLIAGGKDKEMDFAPLAPLVKQRVKVLILLGEAKEKLNRAIGDHSETYLVGTFEEAVLLAYQKSRTGDIILLSPGCASTDMFRNYEERGNYFKKLVKQI